MTAEIPSEIVAYVAARDRQRAERVDETLAALTDRERLLVREAAVMGYVEGREDGRIFGNERGVPRDELIVRNVIACCQTYPDLYPTLGRKDPR